MIERQRLVRLLMDQPEASIISVTAPAGYGKTALLAQWTAREERPVAWLTLDDLDNDPAVLVSHLAAAFDRIRPIDGSIWSGLSASGKRILASAVPKLASELHRWRHPAVLVLDDAHALVDPACLDALAALLDHLPPGLRVAIAGRTEPALPFARFRAERNLLEIGPALLALDEGETAALTATAGCPLDRDEVRALTKRTEGWAAGTYLAALAMSRGERDPAAAGGISGADRDIASYFRSEFERGLDDDDVALLTRMSILGTILPPLADAVTGMPGAGDRLRTLARGNLFVQEIGPRGGSYRYHNLLRDFLGRELERREPGAAPDLHRRAAEWYAKAGRFDRAIEHALASGDTDLAAKLVTVAAVPSFYLGRVATLDRWLGGFGRPAFERYPPLAVVAAWAYLLTGRPDSADRMAEIADRSTFDGPPGDGSASFESQRAMLRAVMGRNGPRDVLANASLAVSQEPPDSLWRAHALLSLASAHLLLGDPDRADAGYADAVAAGASKGHVAAMVALAKRASIRIARGDWEAADRFVRESRAMLLRARYGGNVAALIVHAVSARVAIQRGALDAGREELVRSQLVRPLANHAIPWLSVDALLELARAYLANSDPAGAQIVVREAERIVRRRPALGTLTDELLELRRRLAGAASTLAGSSSLTTAELRVLPFLPTYLSFQDIADRLTISRNTVKTHAMSIYGKLWASSRGEAVGRAVELGLLEPYPALESNGAHEVDRAKADGVSRDGSA